MDKEGHCQEPLSTQHTSAMLKKPVYLIQTKLESHNDKYLYLQNESCIQIPLKSLKSHNPFAGHTLMRKCPAHSNDFLMISKQT